MKLIQTIVLVGFSTMLLTSCFGKTETEKKPEVITGVSQNSLPNPIGTGTGSVEEEKLHSVNVAAEERQRLLKIDTLTDANIKTQTEEKNGKTVLKDRRLFINYIKSKNVNTSKEMIERMGEIKKFASESKVTLSEADNMTIIGIVNMENTKWDMCGEFYNSKAKLDAKNEFYIVIDKLCPPIVTP